MAKIKTESGIHEIPESLGHHVINASGAHGYPGQAFNFTTQDTAGIGRNGHDGRHAAPPCDGNPARDPQIQLAYKPQSPGYVQVQDDNGPYFKLSKEKLLSITARGGNGGDGGFGEAGQHGGEGHRGADATQQSRGGNGGQGGAGGDGGSGTDGGRGGRGGHVRFTVNEYDLDLLLAIDWEIDFRGGKGGKRGAHGAPGMGGRGGAGGSSYSWSESYTAYDKDGEPVTKYHHYTNAGGSRGARGRDGHAPQTLLQDGKDGETGNYRIVVLKDDGEMITYRQRYHLKVESFEVKDENDDGINEPGDFIWVKNIRIRNNGPMPSPSGQLLKVVIRAAPWLIPDISHPLTLPNSIQPGRDVIVPGKLKAQIRHELTPRGSGVPLAALDTVSLFCYSERVRRTVPEFSGGLQIKIEYPLRLGRPTYMDCMTRDDEMAIYWSVQNISTKLLGDQSTSRRRARTVLIDRSSKFVLQNAIAGQSSMEDNIPVVDSDGCPLGEKLTVADDTSVNSSGILGLVLELQDPHLDRMTQVMFWDLPLQVSEEYSFDPTAEFLVVVNATTNAESMAQMQNFIRKRLHLNSDLLNLSLSGSCTDHDLGQSILRRYQKKSIIVAGNSFHSQVNDLQYNWDLMNPNDVLTLAMNGTSFLFCGLSSERAIKSLAKWSSLMGFANPDAKKINAGDIPELHKKERNLLKSIGEQVQNGFVLGTIGEYAPSNALDFLRRKSASELLEQEGQDLLKELDKAEPSRRFIVSSRTRPNDASPKAKTKSKDVDKVVDNLTIAEYLSSAPSCIVSSMPIKAPFEEQLTPQQCALMVASIPFESLVKIFWNIVASVQWNGISAEACYRKLPGFHTPFDSMMRVGQTEVDDGSRLVKPEICDAVAVAVRMGIESSVSQTCKAGGGPLDPGSKDVLERASLLQHFLHAIPSEDEESASASETGIGLATWVLGALDAATQASNPLKSVLGSVIPSRLASRRGKLRRSAQEFKRDAVSFMAPPAAAAAIGKGIESARKDPYRDESRKNGEQETVVRRVHRRLEARYKEQLAATQGLLGLSAASKGSVYVSAAEFKKRLSAQQALLSKQETNLILTQEARNEMLVNIGIEQNYIPLASLKLGGDDD